MAMTSSCLRTMEIKAVEQLLRSEYTVNVVSVIGDGSLQQGSCDSEQDRAVRAAEQSKQDGDGNRARPTSCGHLVAREHGLDSRSNGVDTPRVKKSESHMFAGLESPPLDREGVRLYRSGAMRISYLGQDRADVQEAAKCLSRRMQSPTQADLVELKRAVRYLLKFPRALFVFEEQQLPKELNGWVDADFAGDLVSRRSSSGLVFLFGRHCLETSSSVQEPIGLSSGESEFDACVKGGAALLGMRSLRLDWGVCPKLTLKIRTDSSAAKGFGTRARLGTPEARLYSFSMVARQSEQGRVGGFESWHSRPMVVFGVRMVLWRLSSWTGHWLLGRMLREFRFGLFLQVCRRFHQRCRRGGCT